MNAQGRKNREAKVLEAMKKFPGRYRTTNQWIILINNVIIQRYKVRNQFILTHILKGLKSKRLIIERDNMFCYKKESIGDRERHGLAKFPHLSLAY